MVDEKIFIGTLNELASNLLKEYINQKSFSKTQINYSPKEDSVASGEVTVQSNGFILTLSLSNENDKQIDNIKVFSDEYINGFTNKILRKGQVYQLTFIFAYIDGNSNVKCKYPSLLGNWSEWESHWKSNTLDSDCIAFAAVNLLEGENLHKNVTLEELDTEVSDIKSDVATISRTTDNTFVFDIAELKAKEIFTTFKSEVTETGDVSYPYSVTYTQQVRYGTTAPTTGALTSFINTELGLKYYKANNWFATTLGGTLDVRYVGDLVLLQYPHKIQNHLNYITSLAINSYTVITSVEAYSQSNVHAIAIKNTVKFATEPTETTVADIEKYLNGEANSKGRYAKKIYVRIEVPETKEVSVL